MRQSRVVGFIENDYVRAISRSKPDRSRQESVNCQTRCRFPATDRPATLWGMSKPPAPKSDSKKRKDPYLSALGKAWPTILTAYNDFKDSKPIIEYRLRQKLVLAYPAIPYINDLTERTRKQTRRIYRDTVAEGQLMVFVRDTRKRVLRSYVLPIEEPERAGSESALL